MNTPEKGFDFAPKFETQSDRYDMMFVSLLGKSKSEVFDFLRSQDANSDINLLFERADKFQLMLVLNENTEELVKNLKDFLLVDESVTGEQIFELLSWIKEFQESESEQALQKEFSTVDDITSERLHEFSDDGAIESTLRQVLMGNKIEWEGIKDADKMLSLLALISETLWAFNQDGRIPEPVFSLVESEGVSSDILAENLNRAMPMLREHYKVLCAKEVDTLIKNEIDPSFKAFLHSLKDIHIEDLEKQDLSEIDFVAWNKQAHRVSLWLSSLGEKPTQEDFAMVAQVFDDNLDGVDITEIKKYNAKLNRLEGIIFNARPL